MLIKQYFDIFINTLSSKKYWLSYTAILLCFIAIFFAFPSYDQIDIEKGWNPIFEKGAHPFTNSDHNSGTHAAKLTFRLTAPLIVHALHLNVTGALILFGIIGLMSFWLVLKITHRIFDDKRTTIIVGLCTAFIYFGKLSFTSVVSGFVDGMAIFFLLLAIYTKSNILRSLLVVIAAFTDERALIASSILAVLYIVESNSASIKRLFQPNCISVYIAWGIYFTIRVTLANSYNLQTDTKGVGLSVLFNQINNIPMGIWSALEGLWIIVFYSWYLLLNKKKYLELLLFVWCSAIILLVGVSVVDISRSVVYLFPAIFVSFSIIKKTSNLATFNKLLIYSLILCFIYPAYYVGGKKTIWWTYPFPLAILRYLNIG